MIPNRREMNLVFREDLYSFVAHSFRVLEPGNRFMPAAYLELICAALMQGRRPSGEAAHRQLGAQTFEIHRDFRGIPRLAPDARSENQDRGHLSQRHART